MQGGAVSNIDGFLWKDTCVSSTQLNKQIWSKQRLPNLETPKLKEVFL
jgi:hypothetical protein